jgi:hypothetical protein
MVLGGSPAQAHASDGRDPRQAAAGSVIFLSSDNRPLSSNQGYCIQPVMRYLLPLSALLLCSCAVNTVNTPPTVDMRGVDGSKYANDLAECQEKARNGGFVQAGAPVSRCLEERGYQVTQRLS